MSGHGLTTQADPEKLPWIEKYRARKFDEIVGHDHDILSFKKLLDDKSLPHLLFYGPPGTGKTSMILCLARYLYGEDMYKKYILEINASSDRGIDTIRDDVVNFTKTKSDKVKIIILDEFDAMTDVAQSALRGVMEAYSGNNRFCLICNNMNKVIPAIQSRCVRLRFSSLDKLSVKKKLDYIIEQENINIDTEAVDTLIELEPDFRQLINSLQGIHYLYSKQDTIKKDNVLQYLGKPNSADIDKIVYGLLHYNFDEIYRILLDMLKSNRWNIGDMTQYLLRKLLVTDLGNIERKHYLIEKLAEIEFRVKCSRDSEIQLAYLVSSFIASRTLT